METYPARFPVRPERRKSRRASSDPDIVRLLTVVGLEGLFSNAPMPLRLRCGGRELR